MIPEKFKERMKNMLGEDYPAFIRALEEDKNVRGMRVNTEKCSEDLFLSAFPYPTRKISYAKSGYILDSDAPVGNLAAHHAGIIYMQDPGAMASVSCLDIPKGAYVIDMCAAPGGKSGQAAALIGDEGFLLSNEYVPKRAKITVGNLERLGIRNAYVTSLDTCEFKSMFSDFFDVAIADVPCSGEGMFRKSDESLTEWSCENVLVSAKRQREILENTAPLVKCGGHIIYSTCTYSLEENEMNIYSFLTAHPEFELCEVKEEVRAVTCDGISYLGEETEILKKCRRFYPHVSDGEGQFVALLKKKEGDSPPRVLFKPKTTPLTRDEKKIVDSFLEDTLAASPKGEIIKNGEYVYLIPSVPPPPKSLFMCGVMIGEISRTRLIPAHQFFSAYGKDFKNKFELSEEEDLLERYLRGEEIEIPKSENLSKGYCIVTYLGAPLGGGKAVDGRIKNHYPKGLRLVK